MKEIPEITIEEVIARYSALLLDAYGVLAHSEGALPGAAELINRLNRTGKPYYMLTNDASMLPTSRARRYQGYGLPIPPERIITSGGLLKGYFEAHKLRGARCVALGPEDSARYVEDAGGLVVAPTEDFDVFVIGDQAGFPFLETVDAVLSALFRKLDRQEKPHLVLPNPDLIYPAANQGFGIASGSVALIFEAALELRYPHRADLRFVRLGKPYPAIFEEALRRSDTFDMVMIGDQLETDIRGANAFGLDSVLIETGVTPPDMSLIPENLRPTYRMRSLAP
jgi:HAD superfamily hydrolase (TIGR01450 family)